MSAHGDGNTADDLQAVLTRYVDSTDGYAHAASLVEDQVLAPVFLEIGQARAGIIPEVSAMIGRHGREPVEEGSIEGMAHRWWMSARDAMTSDDMKVLLEECLRGETVLLNAINRAWEKCGDGSGEDSVALRHASEDVRKAIAHFGAALHNRHFE